MAKKDRRGLMEGATNAGSAKNEEQEEVNFTRARDDKYSSFRIKTSVLQRFKNEADRRGYAFPGQLVHKALEDWLKDNAKA